MGLRGTKPEPVNKRLKLFMYSPAGVGKTTAALQFPNAYIIDAERGTENYDKIISKSGSVVFHTTDVNEVIAELKLLLSERHDFRTLVIDPISPIYNELLDKAGDEVGEAHGRHYGRANKVMKRMANLIMALDMNVVITSHAKAEYGDNLKKIGNTFDAWKALDYWFDLVLELERKGKGKTAKRMARVVKSRIETFPDADEFEWSYEAVRARWDVTTLERSSAARRFATEEQLTTIQRLLTAVRLPENLVSAWFIKAGVDSWEDMSEEIIGKCIGYIKDRFPQQYAATILQSQKGWTPPVSGAEFNPDPNSSGGDEHKNRMSAFEEAEDEVARLRRITEEKQAAAANGNGNGSGTPGAGVATISPPPPPPPTSAAPVETSTTKTETAPAGALTEASVAEWDTFYELWTQAAMDAEWTPQEAEKTLGYRLLIIGKKAKPQDTRPGWRLEVLQALRAGRIDRTTGNISKP